MHTVLWENEGGNALNFQSHVGTGKNFIDCLLGGDVSGEDVKRHRRKKRFKRFISEGEEMIKPACGFSQKSRKTLKNC